MKISIKQIITTLGILIILGGIHFSLIPAVLSSNFITNKIKTAVLNNYGFNLTLDNFKVKTCITPHIRIKAKEINFKKHKTNESFQVQNINTKINLLNLIFRTLSIKNLEADNINLTINTDYSEYIFSPKIINIIKKTTLKNINIHNLDLNIKNQKLIDDINIFGSDILITKFNLQKRIKTNITLFVKDKTHAGSVKANLNLNLPLSNKNIHKSSATININNLNLNTFSKTINKLSKNIENIDGTITLNLLKENADFFSINLLSDKFKLKLVNNDLAIYHTKPIELKTIISIINDKITINSFKIISDLIKASIFGSIELNDNKKPADLKFSVSLDKSNLAELIRLLPPFKDLIEDLNLYALKKHFINGDVLAHMDISGKTSRPQINGSILIKDAYVIQPIKNTKKAIIKLIFNRDKMTLDTVVPISNKERITANGTFELFDTKQCNLKVKSTQKVNLETVQTIINPLQEIIKIDFGPVPIMKLKGYGNIDIKVLGNKTDPHINGMLNITDGQASFIDMPNLIIKNINAGLNFADINTTFKTTNATLNSTPISINGNCDLDGNFNFNIISAKQNLNKFLLDIKENTLLKDFNTYINEIENIKGFGDIQLNLYGKIKNITDIEFNKNIFAKGAINLTAVTLKLKTIPQAISNIFGEINIENQDLIMNIYALLNKSKITIDGKIKDSQANLIIKTKDFRIIDGIATLPIEQRRNILTLIQSNEILTLLPTINTSFTARYKGSVTPISSQNLETYGTIYSTRPEFKKATFDIVNSTLKFTPIKIYCNDLKLDTSGTISNLFMENPTFSGIFNIKDFNLGLLNTSIIKNIEAIKPLTTNLKKLEGKVNLTSEILNNNINANLDIKNIKLFNDKHIHEILNGKIQIKNNILNTNGINARFFDMPILLNGKISLFNNKEKFYNLIINAKPNQEFLNSLYNQNAIYPIKVKGDLTLNAEITGNQKQAQIKSDLLLEKDSSIYYMGATLGDKSNAVNLSSNITLKENGIKINNFNYDKIISSLDNNPTTVPLLNINGTMNYAPNNIINFDNLKIKSKMPVDAKIFNIIFRKPFVKQGVFTSDLTLNGTSLKPYFLGKLNITDINIPLVETNINNINFDFTPRFIHLTSRGDLLTNNINLSATLKNNLTLPLHVENMNVHVNQLDVNKITQKIKHIEENNFKIHATQNIAQPLDYTNLIIHNSTVTADTILIRDIIANNYTSNLEIDSDKTLKIKSFNFDMAEGKINGAVTHNYKNNNININLTLNKANAEKIAKSLFNIKDQIYGLANGKITLSCNAQTDKTCLATLNGFGNFEIQNGKMPKLGSLEYLLKASNLINNGLSGLTISGLIDLLSPLKSGEFKTINGNFKINNGIAENINIYSSGKDLNLYITGIYNLTNSNAEFTIFGSLSKNITTVFNKVKNLSLNTLLKTIPGVKDNSNTTFTSEISQIPNSNEINNIYKFFRVIINGDINGENFVKSFEWIEQ